MWHRLSKFLDDVVGEFADGDAFDVPVFRGWAFQTEAGEVWAAAAEVGEPLGVDNGTGRDMNVQFAELGELWCG